jgi:hypothetical protein
VTPGVCSSSIDDGTGSPFIRGRDYRRSRTPLLLYSAVCFVFLALNNLFLVIDILVLPSQIDLSVIRLVASLAGVLTLLYGFIWEVD